MSAADDLTTWLRAQLDEDERVARESKGAYWYTDGHSDQANAFMERFDEDRMLADVEAKRNILEWCRRMDPMPGMGGLLAGEGRKLARILARAYTGRDGWREEWGTDG